MRKRDTHAVGVDLGAGEEKSLERPLSAPIEPRTAANPECTVAPLATFAALIAHLAGERQPKTGAQGGAKQPHGGA
jgi:hypothetical protein